MTSFTDQHRERFLALLCRYLDYGVAAAHPLWQELETAYRERGCTRGTRAIKPATRANTFIVDHRYAQDQMRYMLLLHLLYEDQDVEALANKSGLAAQHIRSVCLGKGGLSYLDMSRLIKAMAGDRVELLVSMPWQECGHAFSGEESVPENDEFKKIHKYEFAQLLWCAQAKGILPNSAIETKEAKATKEGARCCPVCGIGWERQPNG